MRPDRIEVEGFGTFREPTEIDFTGAELFALTGATGAGKSTVIDAMCFALYGIVPRLDDQRLVAPAISQGKLEARVRLDFTAGGEAYTAVRVVRATKAGATTKEARLERTRDQVVLAGNEKELTEAVERLLGLTYRHFTTCVVLPQGDFARFMHHKPRDRQDLLVELLDLGVYGRMREAAKTRESVARTRRELGLAELARLAHATPARLDELTARVERLDEVLAAVDAAQPQLDTFAADAAAARATAAQARADAALLAPVEVPRGTATIADRTAGARAALDEARKLAGEAADGLLEASAAVEGATPRAVLEGVLRDRADLEALQARLDTGRAQVAELRSAAEAASASDRDAQQARDDAADALEAARRADRAEEFVLLLAVGEPCPICQQPVSQVPEHEGGHVAGATQALARAEQALASAAKAATAAARELERNETHLAVLVEQQAQLAERLASAASVAQATAELERLTAAETALAAAKQADAASRSRTRAAEGEVTAAEQQAVVAWQAFDAMRDRVAHLGPPPAARTDLQADWSALVTFAREAMPALEQAAADAVARVEAADASRRQIVDALGERCAAVGVEAGDEPGRAVSAALGTARAELTVVTEAVARVEVLQREDETHEVTEALARELARHLNANMFEKWVLDESLRRLVTSATAILGELSQGTYSLTLDAKSSNFCVIDHANADAVRSARTLSGGETFLASLSLALALADEVAQMAVGGAARLDSIFLDEGFGTLDADTLDTVAGALEELQARGRMVGVISHVPELAERMPVRFHVAKGPTGSTVTRSEA